VSRSSTESKNCAMANATRKLVWVRDLLTKLDFPPKYTMRLYYDNHATVHIAENSVFQKRIKHIEVD